MSDLIRGQTNAVRSTHRLELTDQFGDRDLHLSASLGRQSLADARSSIGIGFSFQVEFQHPRSVAGLVGHPPRGRRFA